MMKEEFEKRIGLVITCDEYKGIEKAYMGLPETLNKDRFVKIWLREGGIQDLFDKRQAKIMRLEEALAEAEKELKQAEEKSGSWYSAWSDQLEKTKELEGKLSAINTIAAV